MSKSRLPDETREKVIVLLQIGLGNTEIAVWTGVNPLTVSHYRQRIQTEISGKGIKNREKIVSLAIKSWKEWIESKDSFHRETITAMLWNRLIRPFLDNIYQGIAQCNFLLTPQTPMEKLWWEAFDKENIRKMVEDVFREKVDSGVYGTSAIREKVRQQFRAGRALPCWQGRDDAVIDQVLMTLTERERQTIEGLFGLRDGVAKTPQQVAEEITVSPARVHQLKAAGIGKIAKSLTWFRLLAANNEYSWNPFCWVSIWSEYTAEARRRESGDAKSSLLDDVRDELLGVIKMAFPGKTIHFVERETDIEEGAKDKVLGISIDDIDSPLTIKTYNCLKKEGIETLGDLVQRTEYDLMNIRNLGKKSLAEVQEILAVHGLKLKEEVIEIPEEDIEEELYCDDEYE